MERDIYPMFETVRLINRHIFFIESSVDNREKLETILQGTPVPMSDSKVKLKLPIGQLVNINGNEYGLVSDPNGFELEFDARNKLDPTNMRYAYFHDFRIGVRSKPPSPERERK